MQHLPGNSFPVAHPVEQDGALINSRALTGFINCKEARVTHTEATDLLKKR